jgi:hypothetical protein
VGTPKGITGHLPHCAVNSTLLPRKGSQCPGYDMERLTTNRLCSQIASARRTNMVDTLDLIAVEVTRELPARVR